MFLENLFSSSSHILPFLFLPVIERLKRKQPDQFNSEVMMDTVYVDLFQLYDDSVLRLFEVTQESCKTISFWGVGRAV